MSLQQNRIMPVSCIQSRKMKKILLLSASLLVTFVASAQGSFESFYDREFNFDVLHITGTLIGIFLVTSFFLSIIRLFLDSRIKNRMIEKGVPETVVEQFLQPTNRDSKSNAIKWFLVTACGGLGLAVISITLPLGIHSVSIMAISISLGFLAYYFYIRRSKK
jgi:hypothetical protein